MKIKHIPFLALAVAFASCSTAYRTGQTPDDVYYSPAPQQNTYASKDGQQDDSYVVPESEQDRNSYYYRNEEQEIRRGIEDPVYRNSITFSMGGGYIPYSFSLFGGGPFGNSLYQPYGFNYYGYDPFTPYAYNPYGFNSSYHSFVYNDMIFSSPYGYGYHNFGYSPYSFGYSPYSYGYSPYSFYSPYYLRLGKVNTNTGARKYNLNAYNNRSNAGAGNATGISQGNAMPVRTMTSGTSAPVRSTTTAPTERRTGVGKVIRRVFTPSERNSYNTPRSNSARSRRSYNNTRTYNRSNNTNTRTYNNNRSSNTQTRSFEPRNNSSVSTPSSPSRSSSSSSRSSAPVRSFKR